MCVVVCDRQGEGRRGREHDGFCDKSNGNKYTNCSKTDDAKIKTIKIGPVLEVGEDYSPHCNEGHDN